jgi:hypothetical protein
VAALRHLRERGLSVVEAIRSVLAERSGEV